MAFGERADPWFEELYARSVDDLERIPWARLAPRPELVTWLDRHPPASGTSAMVVACGLGDDAEELARRDCTVEAFDLSPSAIAAARRRFSASTVRYEGLDARDQAWSALAANSSAVGILIGWGAGWVIRSGLPNGSRRPQSIP